MDIITPVRPPPGLAGADLRAAVLACEVPETRRRLRLYLACDDDEYVRDHVLALGRQDPAWWHDTHLWSRDPRRRDGDMIPVVLWDHQREYIQALAEGHKTAMNKSRDAGATVITVGEMVRRAVSEPTGTYSGGVASKTGADVVGHPWDSLIGKARFFLDNLPGYLQPGYSYIGSPQPVITVTATGNTISGRMSTPEAWHGSRVTTLLFDESSRIRDLEEHLRGGEGSTDQLVALSTPRGSAGYWPRLVQGDAVDIVDYVPGMPVQPGRWVRVTWPWWLDPRKDAAWAEDKQRGMLAEAFAEQYCCDFRASQPGRIWPEARKNLHLYSESEWNTLVRDGWLRDTILAEAWDVGLNTCVIWAAWDPVRDIMYVVDYRAWYGATVHQIAQDIAQARSVVAPRGWRTAANPDGTLPAIRCADPAIRARLGGLARSWAQDLESVGIDLTSKAISNRVHLLQNLVRHALVLEKLRFSPACEKKHTGPSLWESVTQYHRVVRTDGTVKDEAAKDEYSHLCDALMYDADHIWYGSSTRAYQHTRAGWVPVE